MLRSPVWPGGLTEGYERFTFYILLSFGYSGKADEQRAERSVSFDVDRCSFAPHLPQGDVMNWTTNSVSSEDLLGVYIMPGTFMFAACVRLSRSQLGCCKTRCWEWCQPSHPLCFLGIFSGRVMLQKKGYAIFLVPPHQHPSLVIAIFSGICLFGQMSSRSRVPNLEQDRPHEGPRLWD